MFARTRSALLRTAGVAMLAAAAVLPLTLSSPARAWWQAGIWVPAPVVVAPPPVVYAPPPVVYAPPPVVAYAAPAPGMIWIVPHWAGGYWVRGHWGWRR